MEFGFDVSGLGPDDALDKAGAEWPVFLVPAAAVLPGGHAVPVPGYRFVVAGDEPVGQVGSRYHPVQNRELLSFSSRIADALGSGVERAGVTQGRRRFWCLIPAGHAALIVSTTHTGRGAVSVQMVVPVEDGIVRLGPETASTLSFPHGPTLQARLDEPGEVAGWANAWVLASRSETERLRATAVRPADLSRVLEGVVPEGRASTERKAANRHAVLDAVAGRWVELSGGRKDGWSLLEAVTWYLDRSRKASRRDREDQSVDDSGWVTRAKYAAHGAITA